MPKISALPAAAALTGVEEFAAVQSSATVRTTLNDMATFFASSSSSCTHCGFCDKTVWIPAADIIGTGGATHSEYAMPAITLYTLDFDPDASEYGQFNFKMPSDWNNGPFWLQLVWLTDSAPAANDIQWEVQLLSIGSSGSIGGVLDAARAYVDSSDGNADTLFTTNILNLCPSNYDDGAIINFVVRRDGADIDDTLDVDVRLYGVQLHYTPTGCDVNLLSEFYFTPDSCLGQSYSGDFETEIETAGTSIPITASATVESHEYSSLTFEFVMSGSEGAFNMVISTTGTSFASDSTAVNASATNVSITIPLVAQVVAGDVITFTPSVAPSNNWKLVGVVASVNDTPSGCVTGLP